VIAGDLNMQPTENNVNLFLDAGLVSAQDTAGDPSASTARDPNFPGDRVNWIWGTTDLTFEEFEILASEASDHLPLVADVSLPL
jgi:endonuclease/exonuclease/phosphatase family metal-dependent hydrolase